MPAMRLTVNMDCLQEQGTRVTEPGRNQTPAWFLVPGSRFLPPLEAPKVSEIDATWLSAILRDRAVTAAGRSPVAPIRRGLPGLLLI